MKISNLTGVTLDYWVARTQGLEPVVLNWAGKPACMLRTDRGGLAPFFPSTEYADGGPIIDRDGISLNWSLGPLRRCTASLGRIEYAIGETCLIAAMRASIISRVGDFVVPPADFVSPPKSPIDFLVGRTA